MTGYIPKEKLTAYERWELAAFDAPPEPPPAPEPEAAFAPEPEPVAPPVHEEPVEAVPLPTAEDIERIHNEAHEAGYQAGYEEGAAQAKAEAERLDGLMHSLAQSLQTFDQQVADQLLALGLEIARQLTRSALKVKPELILPVVREALAALPVSHGHPSLTLNPKDAALLREQLGDQISHGGWRLLEDPEMAAGGCRVQAGASDIDASLETRWKRVLESIGTQQDWLQG
ncbi:hypothetical protein AZSI13_00350 [Azospira sp. I13]|uniref:flagellar assembly protein FliH n=1 Tax=Azospira sp. I13 TaxID=1765050 RepID=UPI000D4D69D8|nr:flagellar assembly protein FliH [Azospira sp. I13]GBG00708.1 hypothetical protein AZSI13_00350 [Azospira sp. I13]